MRRVTAKRFQKTLLLPTLAGGAALGLVLFSLPAHADIDPNKEKEKPEEQAPDSAGSNADRDVPTQDPLLPIVDLMREVEDALAEADTDAFTQRQQKRIVEALTLGGNALEKLKKLIEELEAQQGGGGGGGGSSGGQPQPGQGEQGKSGQQRPQSRRDREAASSQSVDPTTGRERQPQQSDRQAENDGRTVRERDLEAAGPERERTRSAGADAWGMLPMKQAEEMLDATARKKPLKYKDALEAYYKSISGQGKD